MTQLIKKYVFIQILKSKNIIFLAQIHVFIQFAVF